MTATNEQIVAEAERRAIEDGGGGAPVEHYIIEVTREGWTPPEPVDPDLLAYRKWEVSQLGNHGYREEVLAGKWDRDITATGFLAGARMAREQEQKRAKRVVDVLDYISKYSPNFAKMAAAAVTAYKAGRTAR